MDKIVGFAIVTKDENYLYFNQISDDEIEAYASSFPSNASLFDSREEAIREACSMISGNSKWHYYFSKDYTPIGVVEVTKLIHVGEIEKLI